MRHACITVVSCLILCLASTSGSLAASVPSRAASTVMPPPLTLTPRNGGHGRRRNLRLRGAGADDPGSLAAAAASEEEEARLIGSTGCMRRQKEVGGAASARGGDEEDEEDAALEELRVHLTEVDSDPSAFLPCTRKGCSRFVRAPGGGGELACGCGQACSEPHILSDTLAVDVRRLWRRLCPPDLVALQPDTYSDAEAEHDEESELAELRASLLPTRPISSLPPGAWATQRLRGVGGDATLASLVLADETTGTLMWSTRPAGGAGGGVHRIVVRDAGNGSASVEWATASTVEPSASQTTQALHQSKEKGLIHLKRLLGVGGGGGRVRMFAVEGDAGDTNTLEGDETYVGNATWLDPETNTWGVRPWNALRVGDVVRVEKMGYFPADLLLLDSPTPSEVCIQTACLDNNTDLRQWQVVPTCLTAADKKAGAHTGGEGATIRKLGSGEAGVVEELRGAGEFIVSPNCIAQEWEGWQSTFCPSNASAADAASFTFRQFLPRNGRLVMTDWVVGMVMYTGKDTCFALNGGWKGCARADRVRKKQLEEDRIRAEQTRKAQVAAMAKGVEPEEYEKETGILWESRFTDVPDDGNCLMHAVWLGLRKLAAFYPELKGDITLPDTAERFRAAAMMKMAKDPLYRDAIMNQLQLWLSVECDVLFCLEDLFLLPPDFQSLVVQMNQEVQAGGVTIDQLDLGSLVNQYIAAVSQKQVDSGREYYLPLGEIELEALCRAFDFRLQVVKTEALDMIVEGARQARNISEDDAKMVQSVVKPTADALLKGGASNEEVSEALRTLTMYIGNVLDSPKDDKFRTIRAGNAAFQKRVASKKAGLELVQSCGFARTEKDGEEFYMLHAEEEEGQPRLRAVKYCLDDFLVEHEQRTGGFGAVTAIVDPRTIHPEHIYDRNRENASKRLVRILNVRTNHYQVHLPRKP